MFCALDPCCAHAAVKPRLKTAAKSNFPICVLLREGGNRTRWPRVGMQLAVATGSSFHSVENFEMLRTLMTIAVAGAFALPVAAPASAANDTIRVARPGGGGDSSGSPKQEGTNPPGQASPGTPRSAASGIDRDTGAASRTNPTGKGAMGATAKHGRFEAL